MKAFAGITITAVFFLFCSTLFSSTIDVRVVSAHSASPSELVAIDLYISQQNETDTFFVDGFDFRLAYDSMVLIPWGIQQHNRFDSCGWFVSIQHDPLVFDSSHNAMTHLRAQAITGSLPLYLQQTPSEPVLTVLFKTRHDSSLFGLSTSIDFLWNHCHDNKLWRNDNLAVYGADNILDAYYDTITDPFATLPTVAGPPGYCSLGSGDTIVFRNTDYYSTEVAFFPFDSVGKTGDINLNGIGFDTTDLALFSSFFLYGDTVFSLAHDKQLAATDIDRDLKDTTLADLVLTRYVLLQQVPPPVTRSQPKAQFIYDTTAGAVSISVHSEVPIGAYNIRLVKDYSQVDSVIFANMDNPGRYGQATVVWNADTVNLLFLGGLPSEPVISTGVTSLATIYYSGTAPTPRIERIASIEGTNCLLQSPTDITEYTEHQIPGQFRLYQNYPNPFNPSTIITFSLPIHTQWKIEILNLLGQLIQSYHGIDGPGSIQTVWDGTDQLGQPVSSGVYFYRLSVENTIRTKKMLLVR